MPKKLGINTKSVEAKARKEAAKQAKEEELMRVKEDEFWKDEDKHVMRKQNRKDEREKKKTESADRKAMNKEMYESEMSTLKSKNRNEPTKVTRAEINAFIENESFEKRYVSHDENPLQENVNRIVVEGESARDINEAIAILSVKEPEADRHPEKRLKAAYNAFEEENLPKLKADNPNLRLSQLKQILKKEWMRSPDNPMNQRTVAYNEK